MDDLGRLPPEVGAALLGQPEDQDARPEAPGQAGGDQSPENGENVQQHGQPAGLDAEGGRMALNHLFVQSIFPSLCRSACHFSRAI